MGHLPGRPEENDPDRILQDQPGRQPVHQRGEAAAAAQPRSNLCPTHSVCLTTAVNTEVILHSCFEAGFGFSQSLFTLRLDAADLGLLPVIVKLGC